MVDDWMDEARCAEIGGDDIWFPPKGASVDAAKRICEDCPVRNQCLQYGMYELTGIYGGTTAYERKRIRLSLPKPPRKKQTECQKAGHDWTNPDNVRTKQNGTRYCGECDRIAHHQRKMRGAAA